ncbi:MAG: glycogen synthase GlgA [Bacillota bacterium]
MNILFVAAEGLPFVKTGGLGDVIASLPKVLREKNVDARVILPLYGDIPAHFKGKMELIKELTVPLSWRKQYCGLKTLVHDGVKFYFLDNEYYFKRNGIYGFYDDAERFSYFCRAVLEVLPYLDFEPQIIHCHDWHTGMVSVFREVFYNNPGYDKLRTVFTIHNLAYQGVFSGYIRGDILGFDNRSFATKNKHFDGDINFMKAGIIFSDLVTTVSRTYAAEILQPQYGEGLDGLLRENRGKLSGILNGIDYQEFNPLTDPALYFNYRNSLEKKAQNKCRLQEELGLTVSGRTPLLIVISRLVQQKGLDLLIHILEELLQADLQLIVLGTGEQEYEKVFLGCAARHPEKMAARIAFDDSLARRMYAASDIFLMPSRFEPCGLGQLIAMRYGSVPVVRETGGLKDTVHPYFEGPHEGAGQGNGFTFVDYNAHEFLFAVKRALGFYYQPDSWAKVARNVLRADYSWERSAAEYLQLYQTLVKQ